MQITAIDVTFIIPFRSPAVQGFAQEGRYQEGHREDPEGSVHRQGWHPHQEQVCRPQDR